jgi:hypothetical protein
MQNECLSANLPSGTEKIDLTTAYIIESTDTNVMEKASSFI